MRRGILIGLCAVLALFFLSKAFQKAPVSTNISVTPTQTPIEINTKIGNQNIVVASPKKNQIVEGSLKIEGVARVFENQLNYEIKDKNGNVIEKGSLYANAPDTGKFGIFQKTVSDLTKGDLVLNVFDYSPKDGSKKDSVSVDFTFK